MKNIVCSIILLILPACNNSKDDSTPSSTNNFPADPYDAVFVTSDIDLFWNAFDILVQDTSSNPFQQLYLDKGSRGLSGFIPNKRIINAAELWARVQS